MKVNKSRRRPNRRKRWTESENRRLRRLYPVHSNRRLAHEFGRTAQAVAGQAFLLGLKKLVSEGSRRGSAGWKKWSPKDIDFLRRHYKKMTFPDIAATMGRSCASVAVKAECLGLKKIKVWTAEEKELLGKSYPGRTLKGLGDTFGCLEGVVSYQAKKMGISKKLRLWTDAEIKYLRENYGLMSSAQLAKYIGRSPRTVQVKASALGLIKQRRWTEKEMQYMRRHYKGTKAAAIAKLLGKSVGAVRAWAFRMGLRRIYWTKDEDDRFRDLYPKNTNEWLARKFKRSAATIWARGHKLGLSKDK